MTRRCQICGRLAKTYKGEVWCVSCMAEAIRQLPGMIDQAFLAVGMALDAMIRGFDQVGPALEAALRESSGR